MAKTYDFHPRLGGTINLPVYTESVFYDAFPSASEEDYMDFLDKNEIEMIKQIEENQKEKIQKIRKVFMDDEFLNWLWDNKKKNTEQTRSEYMAQLTDKKVTEIWEREYGHFLIESHFIPAAVFSKNDFYVESLIELPNGATTELKKQLAEFWKENGVAEDDILIKETLIAPDLYQKEEERMAFTAFAHFFENELFQVEIEEKKGPKKLANLGVRYLPVFIKRENPPIVTREQIENEYLPEEFPKKMAETISDELTEQIEHGRYGISVYNYLVPGYEFEEFYLSFVESIEQQKLNNQEKEGS